MAQPFLKWVGGKRQLINELKKHLPNDYNRYFEPFIGGGALFFSLEPENAFISDLNCELINTYKVVKDNVEDLIKELLKYKNEKEFYYKIRELDRDLSGYNKLSPIQKAARFIYLNKTCYNGLYRVNKNGQFNVPFGKYKNPKICDIENLKKCSQILKNNIIDIKCGDFSIILDYVRPKDFVYFDPPYVPLNNTSNFTSYTSDGFGAETQCKLEQVCKELTNEGVFWMLSNSYTEFILELYKNYNIHIVHAKRSINCRGNSRGKIKEVIITNY